MALIKDSFGDWWLAAGLGCLIAASLLGLWGWAAGLLTEADEEELERREWYQTEMRATILQMIDNPAHEEWYLHELLYEYRHGMAGWAGGTEFERVYGHVVT